MIKVANEVPKKLSHQQCRYVGNKLLNVYDVLQKKTVQRFELGSFEYVVRRRHHHGAANWTKISSYCQLTYLQLFE